MKKYKFLCLLTMMMVVVGANAQPSLSGSGTEADPYQISSKTDLATLATYVNGGNNCEGLYFKVTQDIDYSPASNTTNNFTPIGNDSRNFAGHFDGDGHTIKGLRYDHSDNSYCGLFGNTSSATIENVILNNVSIKGLTRVGGIVGHAYATTVSNCQVTNATITGTNSTSYAYGSIGGIVGRKEYGTVSECVFNGTVSGNKYIAGIVGYNYYQGYNTPSTTISRCLVINSTIGAYDSNVYNLISDSGVDNSYYTGCKLRTTSMNNCYVIQLTKNYSITISPSPMTTICNYAVMNSNVAGQYISLGPGGYSFSAATINFVSGVGSHIDVTGLNYEFQMPNNSVSVSATPIDFVTSLNTGEENAPYIIYNTYQLNLLSQRFNDGTSYSGKYFKLGADITLSYDGLGSDESNFTAIGSYNKPFDAHFDGNNKTISGIRIRKGSADFQGFFGGLAANVEVKNLTLTDADITGKDYVGGIVGYNRGTVTGCTVTNSVYIRATNNFSHYHGGIVGTNFGEVNQPNTRATISNCTSSAKLTIEGGATSCSNYAGLIGENYGVVSDNLVINAVLPAIGPSAVAIAGHHGNPGVMQRNYYTACTVADTENATSVGYYVSGNQHSDLNNTNNPNGAVSIHTITVGSGLTLTTPSNPTITISSTAYYAQGTSMTLSCDPLFIVTATNTSTNEAVEVTTVENGVSFTMPAGDVTVSGDYDYATLWHADDSHDGTTADRAYIITTTDGWNLLATRVAAGESYEGKFFELGASIDITTTVGTSVGQTDNPFSGTFDGKGYALNVNLNETSLEGTAPFRAIKNATIKNLIVNGSVNGTTHAAGLVGFALGTSSSVVNTIENCLVNTNVTVNTGTNKHTGGIVGHGKKCQLVLTDCVYTGTMTCGSHYAGGLQGWSDGNTLVFNNCIFAGSFVNDGDAKFHPVAVRNDGYYTTTTDCNNIWYTEEPTLTSTGYIALDGTKVFKLTAEPSNTSVTGSSVTTHTDTGISVFNTGMAFGGKYYVSTIGLHDNASNDALISEVATNYANEAVSVTLFNRTLYKDGNWNTICLPFNVDLSDENGPLYGAEAKTLTSVTTSENVTNINFGNPVNTLLAGMPYIIRWGTPENPAGGTIQNPVFTGVTIDNSADAIARMTISKASDQVKFIGYYSAMPITAANSDIWYMTADNTLKHTGVARTLHACRAYFRFTGAAQNASRIVLDFGDDATSIGELKNENRGTRNDVVYDLSGRKVSGSTATLKKGVYILNGRTVVVK